MNLWSDSLDGLEDCKSPPRGAPTPRETPRSRAEDGLDTDTADAEEPWLALVAEDLATGVWGARLVDLEDG
jgi:hypothetical protein